MDHDTIRALIQKYRTQIEFLQAMVAQLESETEQGGSSDGRPPQSQTGREPVSSVHQWQFYNKSQPEAAEELLSFVGHPLGISELVDGLEKGGLKIGGNTLLDKKQNLSTVLSRSGRFGKAGRGAWGLPTWPNITPVKSKSGHKSKRGKKAAASDVA